MAEGQAQQDIGWYAATFCSFCLGAFSRVSGVPFLRKLNLCIFDSTLGDTMGATLDFDPVAEFGNPFLRIGANRCQFIAQFVGSKLGYRPGIAFTRKLLGKCSRRALWLAPLSCCGFCQTEMVQLIRGLSCQPFGGLFGGALVAKLILGLLGNARKGFFGSQLLSQQLLRLLTTLHGSFPSIAFTGKLRREIL